ncbi:phosphohydrolase [Bifidobacterium aemilianum]|uniref:Phosphohydrolase n=1 Tax=Bifidobacterium aemilianum TaxID=2493120 RepID=A0A366K7R4_9BIFI|nr:HD domain-containing protein [Bifidobacterium aemilianum]RBP97292.1 phosphohydrolase [Bifidobacterium aemilianum]
MTVSIPSIEETDQLHRAIAPSQAAYELIHTHCLIVADITSRLVRRQNALFSRRCTLPTDAPELTGHYDLPALLGDTGTGVPSAGGFSDSAETVGSVGLTDFSDAAGPAGSSNPDSHMPQSAPVPGSARAHITAPVVPPTDGVTGGIVPPRLLGEHEAVIGALLHDIGTYLVLKADGSDGGPLEFDGSNYILHGLRGYRYLLDQGVDESIAQFARNHTGVGLTAEQVKAQDLPLPVDDYVPMNLEQEVVMVADKYNSKSTPPKFLTAAAYAAKAARFGESNRRNWLDLLVKYGVPDIPSMARHYQQRLVEE